MKPVHRSKYSKWRALSLLLVYLLISVHIAHWFIAKKTLAPLEFNEVLYTIHRGIITAGFIFMTLTIVSSMIFGRFFCSWACHILALEDLSAWILSKMKIKPVRVRSRVFYLVPVVAMLYLFAWPQIERMIAGNAFPGFHLQTDVDGWASFSTNDFWRNLPGIPITLITFFSVGFLIVYLLGTRSFCTYGCPYGVVFGISDRLAPGKIKLTGNCNDCGLCTANCQSHIDVHKELREYGKVINTSCLKDLDCVAVCPNTAIEYGMAKPTLLLSSRKNEKLKRKYSVSVKEDILLGLLILIFTLIFRGLYDAIPFLLATTFAVCLSWISLLFIRMFYSEYVHIGRISLRQGYRATSKGKFFGTIVLIAWVFTIHSAYVHYHSWKGEQIYDEMVIRGKTVQLDLRISDAGERMNDALEELLKAEQAGIWTPVSLERELASIFIFKKDYPNASIHLSRMLTQEPSDREARLRYAKILILQGEMQKAAGELRIIVQDNQHVSFHDKRIMADAYIALGHIEEQNGFASEAEGNYSHALEIDHGNAEASLALGVLQTRAGRFKEAEALLLHCDSLSPNSPLILNNLGVIYMQTGRLQVAALVLKRLTELQPGNTIATYNLGMILYRLHQTNEALLFLNKAVELDPNYGKAHEALVGIYDEMGLTKEADAHRSKTGNSSSSANNPAHP